MVHGRVLNRQARTGEVRSLLSHDHLVGRHFWYVCSCRGERVGILNLRITVGRVVLVVFEAVEVLVAFPARVAAVWFMLFHAQGTGIGVQGLGINNREGAIVIVFEGLSIVAVLVTISKDQSRQGARDAYALMILQTILVLVCLLTSNHRTVERFRDTTISGGVWNPSQLLLFSYRLRELTILAVLPVAELSSRSRLSRLLRLVEATVEVEQSFRWLVDAIVAHPIIVVKVVATISLVLTLHVLHVAHIHTSHVSKEVSVQFARCAGS